MDRERLYLNSCEDCGARWRSRAEENQCKYCDSRNIYSLPEQPEYDVRKNKNYPKYLD